MSEAPRRRRPWIGPLVGLLLLGLAAGLHEVALRWLDGHAILDVMLAPTGAPQLLTLLAAVGFLALRLLLLVLGPGVAAVGLLRLGVALIPERR